MCRMLIPCPGACRTQLTNSASLGLTKPFPVSVEPLQIFFFIPKVTQRQMHQVTCAALRAMCSLALAQAAWLEIGSWARNVQRAGLWLNTWWCLLFWDLIPESSWLFLLNSWLWIRPYVHIFNLELFGILNSIIIFLISFLDAGGVVSAELCQKMYQTSQLINLCFNTAWFM